MAVVVERAPFPVSIRWRGGRLARLDAPGKESLELAWPPGLDDGEADQWTPEELLAAAVATSYAQTLAAVAEERGAPLIDASIGATGGPDCTAIELDARLETIAGAAYAVACAAGVAEERCPVMRALDAPVRVTVEVTAVPTATSRPSSRAR